MPQFSLPCISAPPIQANSTPTPNGIPLLDNLAGLSVNAATVTEIINSGATFGPVRAVTASGNILDTDELMRADTSAGNVILTLPPAATVTGQRIIVKRITGGGNSLTIAGNGAELIDGANTNASLSAQWSKITLYSNGVGWDIIG